MLILKIVVFLLTVVDSITNLQDSVCETCHCLNHQGQFIIDCSNKNLTEIPPDIPYNTSTLTLKDNHIDEIKDFIFSNTKLVNLDISKNALNNLSQNSFYGLESLVTLNLQHNQLDLDNKSYPDDVFKPLVKLKRLDLSSNLGKYTRNPTYPNLRHLISLQKLKIDGIPNLYLREFSDLQNLTHLNFSGNCQTANIFIDSFHHVFHIEELVLSHCHLRYIDNFTFSVFPQLRFLDLSFNSNLGLDRASMALFSLNSPDMRVLNLSAIVDTFAVGVVITALHIYRIKHLNITELYLDHNRFELIETEAIPQIPKYIQLFSMRDNRPTYGAYIIGLEKMMNLICLDASYQYTSHNPVGHPLSSRYVSSYSKSRYNFRKLCSSDLTWSRHQSPNFTEKEQSRLSKLNTPVDKGDLHGRNNFPALRKLSFDDILNPKLNVPIPIPPNLKYANCSYCVLSYPIPKMRFENNSVKVIDVSINILNKWIGPVTGLDDLEWLSLSNNFCDYIGDTFFDYLPNLRELYIASNFLAVVLEADVNGNIFSNLKNLELFDISDNKIRILPQKLLRGQVNLKSLDLSKNILKLWTLDIDHMDELQYIDLSSNQLTSLPVKFRNFGEQQYNKNKQLMVDLSDQTLQCTCENLPFLIWMKSNKTVFLRRNEYTCEDNKGKELSLSNLDGIIIQLEKQCASLTAMIIVLTGSLFVIVSVLIGSLVYRYRWKLRYLYYLTRNRYRGAFPLVNDAETEFEFDAFVSYADEDRHLVTQGMREKLEQEQDLRLCIHHRDFVPGEEIAANILSAVRNSKKTLILLTRNFLNSYWCIYELNMAKVESISTGRNVLIVIVCESIPVCDLPEALVQLMNDDSYIDYTDDPEGNVVFWANLTRAINTD
ncbi:toll-like receptor 4 isoform X2 [Patella vulgata]|nr:toll-like receptor 4 isoform X2 [Patella vulgata]